jgi:hypothetical protein
MDGLARFVSEQNIGRFVEALSRETDPNRQDTLRRLLIEEENRFGLFAERLELAERLLGDGATRIEEQTRVVESLKAQGADPTEAERLLRNFVRVQEIFRSFLSILVGSQDQTKL